MRSSSTIHLKRYMPDSQYSWNLYLRKKEIDILIIIFYLKMRNIPSILSLSLIYKSSSHFSIETTIEVKETWEYRHHTVMNRTWNSSNQTFVDSPFKGASQLCFCKMYIIVFWYCTVYTLWFKGCKLSSKTRWEFCQLLL